MNDFFLIFETETQHFRLYKFSSTLSVFCAQRALDTVVYAQIQSRISGIRFWNMI